MPSSPTCCEEIPIRRPEMLTIVLITFLAAAIRIFSISGIAVEHFDEGVYASNLWFSEAEGYQYPNRYLYAPPLLPALIEWSLVIFGSSETWIPAIPSLLASIFTIPLMWWIGRRTSGPVAGLAAAMILAANNVHILYARTALTESLLCFFMLLSVSLANCMCRELTISPRYRFYPFMLAVLSGLMAGLGWWTKYSGWLSLAVIVSGTAGWGLWRYRMREWIWLAIHLGVIVVVAVLVWLPFYFSLNQYGGYSAVAENHRQYFVGWSGWLTSLQYQLSSQWQMSGLLTLLGVVGAALITRQAADEPDLSASPVAQQPLLQASGVWLGASWFLGLSLAIPLYTPYPRLVVPWWIIVCFLLGIVISRLGTRLKSVLKKPVSHRALAMSLLILLYGGTLLDKNFLGVMTWQPRLFIRDIATQVLERTQQTATQEGKSADQVICYVYGEPALFYHLSALNVL
ncbi:MAG: glycosyltransferase family 39 protein, partial [Planctomycetaceae bacterium]|nr:glycosyltransferase family 39 protein [Planctomycetaceae bacterium]